jgi:hypothetical protein
MDDPAKEIQVIRGDIEMLSEMIDRGLEKDVGDPYLLACAQILYLRKKRLAELEAITLYVSRPSEE